MSVPHVFAVAAGLLLGAGNISLAAAADIMTNALSREKTLKKELVRIFNDDAGKDIKKTMIILRKKGYTCRNENRKNGFEYYCYLKPCFIYIAYGVFIPIEMLHGISMAENDGTLKVDLFKYVAMP